MYVTISSDYLEHYIRENPVIKLKRPARNAKHDTPGLVMFEFYRYMAKQGDLFTQKQFYDYLIHSWDEWHSGLTEWQQEQFKRRVYGNFYLSGIDQLYVQATLFESKLFNLIGYDNRLETKGIDVVAVTRTGRRLEIQCMVDTEKARNLHEISEGQIVLFKKLSGPKIGNMYFYKKSDLQPILDIGMFDALIFLDLPIFSQAS